MDTPNPSLNARQVLEDHLQLIDDCAQISGRRHHLSTAEQVRFGSYVVDRLAENDYLLIRGYMRHSPLWTYLAMVIERLSRDFIHERKLGKSSSERFPE